MSLRSKLKDIAALEGPAAAALLEMTSDDEADDEAPGWKPSNESTRLLGPGR